MALSQQFWSAAVLCSAQSLLYPNFFGAKVLSLEANLVSNFSKFVHEGYYLNHGSANVTNASFCNVTVTYTHPGQNDTINVQTWLPDSWNGRMQGIGGGGWAAGMFSLSYMSMIGAIGDGYMATTTDGGHSSEDPSDWALLSPGNVNLYLLQDFGSVSINDASIISKELALRYYGSKPKYSYWNGCSQGGRQGLMIAQRYPEAYDGIVASAPAIYWSEFIIGNLFPQLIMNEMREYPHPCELDALTNAAIAACDGNDGVIDGIIADPETCNFEPHALVGTTINCTTGNTEGVIQISKAAANIAGAAWTGARSSNGSFLWYGLNHDATLTGDLGVAKTQCDNHDNCVGIPVRLFTDWIRLFVQKDPTFDAVNLTRQEYERIFRASVQEFSSIIGTDDTDLGRFRQSGGKMVTYHGLADYIIPPKGTRRYYEAIAAADPGVQDYYRLFESPGLSHCFGGKGGYPAGIFNSLVAWVETGKAPDSLIASSTPDETGVVNHKLLCPYPQKARYVGTGDTQTTENFYCSV